MGLSNQLENKLSLYALDALKNLIIQAFLIEKNELAYNIIQYGYMHCLQQIVEKAVTMLDHETKLQPHAQSSQNQDLYKLVIEQAYINLTDLFHFLEEGKILKELSNSQCVHNSIQIILKYQSYPFLNIKIFTRISQFLKEMSVDNAACKGFYNEELKQYIAGLVSQINAENIEFVANLTCFYLNILEANSGVTLIQQQFDIFQTVVDYVMNQEVPQQIFMKEFSKQFKLAETAKQDQEEVVNENEQIENDEDIVIEGADVQTDKQLSQEMRQWKNLGKANAVVLEIIAALIENAEDSDEEEFEDMEDEEDDQNMDIQEESKVSVSDHKTQTLSKYVLTQKDWFAKSVLRTQAIPQYLGVPGDIDEIIENIQQEAYYLQGKVYSSFKEYILDVNILQQIMLNFKAMLELNQYKCDSLQMEYALELLIMLVQDSSQVKIWVIDNIMELLIKLGNNVDSNETKALIVQVFTLILSTAYENKDIKITSLDINKCVCEILLEDCLSQDLLLISHALNAFFDIYSEENYNQVLIDLNVIEQMKQGLPTLQSLLATEKKSKQLSKRDISFASDSLTNLKSFIDYKLGEFKK